MYTINKEVSMTNNKNYSAFGIIIESSIVLPELFESNKNAEPNVKISYGKVPTKLDPLIRTNPWYDLGQSEFLLRVDGIAKYYVANGNLIVIEKNNQASDADVRVFLYNTVMGQLLHQQGLFLLHGSAIRINNKAHLFLGLSGSGKTAIAYDYHNRNYDVLSDELCPIIFDKTKASVLPGIPQLNVWQDCLEKSGKKIEAYPKIRTGINKYGVSVKDHCCTNTTEISNIILLNPTHSEDLTLKTLLGAEKFKKMMCYIYRIDLMQENTPAERNYLNITALIKTSHVFELNFNTQMHFPSELTKLVRKELN